MKKLFAILFSLAVLCSLAACGTSSSNDAQAPAAGSDIPVIGISQYGEHPSLDNCREGFLLGLEEAGLSEGRDFTVLYQNAGFDDNIAIQIAQNFSANNVSLMCGIATNSATACFAAAEDKDIPVIFNAITDPVQAKLDSGNITGVSDKLPVEAQLDLIRKCQPDAATIGIIYTTSEPNSVSAIAEYKEKAGEYGFEIVDIGVTAQAEVTQAADTLISRGVDCISNLTDNNVVGVLDSILDKTNEAGIPVYGSEIEQVKKGCVASAGIDYIELGKQAGKLAAKVLTGEAVCQDMPYETVTEYSIYVNNEALAAMNIELPADVAEKALDASAE
ncbi:MAG: ABC transporter substrate-binding protein [Clostridia bacterium]|nr:MAG: ABC transporter substrate-binding protein [Clostridia bacterium]